MWSTHGPHVLVCVCACVAAGPRGGLRAAHGALRPVQQGGWGRGEGDDRAKALEEIRLSLVRGLGDPDDRGLVGRCLLCRVGQEGDGVGGPLVKEGCGGGGESGRWVWHLRLRGVFCHDAGRGGAGWRRW
jgi:hypothetical protein